MPAETARRRYRCTPHRGMDHRSGVLLLEILAAVTIMSLSVIACVQAMAWQRRVARDLRRQDDAMAMATAGLAGDTSAVQRIQVRQPGTPDGDLPERTWTFALIPDPAHPDRCLGMRLQIAISQ